MNKSMAYRFAWLTCFALLLTSGYSLASSPNIVVVLMDDVSIFLVRTMVVP